MDLSISGGDEGLWNARECGANEEVRRKERERGRGEIVVGGEVRLSRSEGFAEAQEDAMGSWGGGRTEQNVRCAFSDVGEAGCRGDKGNEGGVEVERWERG